MRAAELKRLHGLPPHGTRRQLEHGTWNLETGLLGPFPSSCPTACRRQLLAAPRCPGDAHHQRSSTGLHTPNPLTARPPLYPLSSVCFNLTVPSLCHPATISKCNFTSSICINILALSRTAFFRATPARRSEFLRAFRDIHKHHTKTQTMENLLSLAFDNLSSYDGPKVRKGLRQVEGLLAQICLSGPKQKDGDDNGGGGGGGETARKDLAQLSRDPAFREFFKLQEGFEWNVPMRLINTLDRLMAKGSDGQNDLLILSALDLIQGVLLLHPPSKSLFSREQNMNVSCCSSRDVLVISINGLLAPPRSPRTVQLPSHPVRNSPDTRRCPY